MKMMKLLTIIFSITMILMIISSMTAVPVNASHSVMNKINNNIEKTTIIETFKEKFTQITDNEIIRLIAILLGLFYILSGLISGFFMMMTIFMGMLGWVFGGLGVIMFIFTIPLAYLTITFLTGGMIILFNNGPLIFYLLLLIGIGAIIYFIIKYDISVLSIIRDLLESFYQFIQVLINAILDKIGIPTNTLKACFDQNNLEEA